MIAVQRHRSILNRVLGEGAVRVSALAEELQVTEETIRRDLRVLSQRGVLERTHGGAVALDRPEQDGRRDLPYDLRQATNPLLKQAIARAALRHIEPGQVLALDPSTTACHLARLLPDQPMTIVTNSLVVCSTLADKRRIEVICTGGTLDAEAMAFFGLPAQHALERLNIERLFFSCRGLDLERGLSEANDRHAAVKLGMIHAARHRTLLLDSSKLGLASTVFYASADVADRLIIDPPATRDGEANLNRLRERGLRVDLAELLPDQPDAPEA